MDTLVALHTGTRDINARGDALMVQHAGGGLDHDAAPGLSHTKTEIRILIIARREITREAAKRLEEIARYHEGGARDVVAVAEEAVFGPLGSCLPP